MKKRKKEFKLLDQINADVDNTFKGKELTNDIVSDFTPTEIEKYNTYNEKVTELDELYTSLKPLQREVILRLIVKDFSKKRDDILIYSKNDIIPVKSGVNDGILYMEVPSPYPFTRKAIVVSVPNENFYVQPGDTVALREKLQIGFKNQDQGYVSVQGGFVHPDYEDDYDNVPEDPEDQHFGYVMVNENLINLKLK